MQNSKLGQFLTWIPTGLIVVAGVVLSIMFISGGIAKIASWYLLQILLPVLGFVALTVVIIRGIARKQVDRSMAIQSGIALLAILPVVLMFGLIAFPASLENTQPAATVRLPANVPLKVFWGGDRQATNYHVIAPDQRWAYDMGVEPYLSGSDRLEDYGCYGVEVVAPADGVVVLVHDGEPDEVPGEVSNNVEAPAGNFVAIQLESQTYLIIAHLQPGSLLVEEGQAVTEGQPIGVCGNSGNTSEPHIHIHHQRQDPNDFPINFAEGLPLYFRDHDGPAMPEGGVEVVEGTPVPVGPTVQHTGE